MSLVEVKTMTFKMEITLRMPAWAMRRAEELRDGMKQMLDEHGRDASKDEVAMLRTATMAGMSLLLHDLINEDCEAGNMRNLNREVPPEGYR